MQRPTAVPRIPASASGVSTQRSAPKRSRSPAVARNTPPARPTSSPITITSASRSSSTWKQSLIASTRVSSLTGKPPQLREVGRERRQRVDVRTFEHERDVGGGLGLRLRDPSAHYVRRRGADLVARRRVEDAEPFEVALVATDALVLLFFFHALEVDVRARVVGRRVRRRPVRQRLDERRAAP